jgi:exodeoxyribonuclease-3
MKIITVNVNGIRAAERKGFFEWLETEDADIVCLQEIKAQEDQLDVRFYPKKYHCYYQPATKKGYSGVGIFCKQKPLKVHTSPWEDINFEGRFLQVDFPNFSVASIYIHSGSAKEERQALKMEFLTQRFLPYLKTLKTNKQAIIFCGDVNIVHKRRDIKNFTSNKNRSGCLPEERAYLDTVFNELNFTDAFRQVNDEDEQYTWWSNRGQAWKNNTGWRIDYQILSPAFQAQTESAYIYKATRFSDHAPLIINYKNLPTT